MNGRNPKSGMPWRATLAPLVIVVFILLGPVACNNGDGGAHTNIDLPGSDNPWAEELASDGASLAVICLLKAAEVPVPEIIVDNLVGLIMGKLFEGGSTPDQEVLDGLKKIANTLAVIESKLQAIQTQLAELEEELKVDTAELDKEIRTQEMDQFITAINSLWDQYVALHKPDGTWITDNTVLSQLADDILNSLNGVFPQLVTIHDELTGEGSVSGSTMEAMQNYATTLVVDGGSARFSSYMMIENYFGAILRAQTRGATLMVEALRYSEANPTYSWKSETYPEDAKYFMQWYTKHIEDQVECFLRQTETFVTGTANPQKGFGEFVPDADKIFHRADLIAAWLSTRHRLDPTKELDGQSFFVYRVIGGPDRVDQYGMEFESSYDLYTSSLYDQNGTDVQYDVPNYRRTDHHAYADLVAGNSPYVQFMHPLDQNGGAKQKGAISDAKEIWTGKYLCAVSSYWEGKYLQEDYYLDDMPEHKNQWVYLQSVDSSGHTSKTGEKRIFYGHLLDIQQPPALLMGDWDISHTHDSREGLEQFSCWLDGEPTVGSQWVYLGVDAWPTAEGDGMGGYYLSGWTHNENAFVGHYYWAGSGSPQLAAHYTVEIEWEVSHNGDPVKERDCGLYLWVEQGDDHGDKGDFPYHNVGSGTDTKPESASVSMAPNSPFYVSMGARMFLDWNDQHADSYDDWHHWGAHYKVEAKDLYFTLPQ